MLCFLVLKTYFHVYNRLVSRKHVKFEINFKIFMNVLILLGFILDLSKKKKKKSFIQDVTSMLYHCWRLSKKRHVKR
jgi:hypothetical protein